MQPVSNDKHEITQLMETMKDEPFQVWLANHGNQYTNGHWTTGLDEDLPDITGGQRTAFMRQKDLWKGFVLARARIERNKTLSRDAQLAELATLANKTLKTMTISYNQALGNSEEAIGVAQARVQKHVQVPASAGEMLQLQEVRAKLATLAPEDRMKVLEHDDVALKATATSTPFLNGMSPTRHQALVGRYVSTIDPRAWTNLEGLKHGQKRLTEAHRGLVADIRKTDLEAAVRLGAEAA